MYLFQLLLTALQKQVDKFLPNLYLQILNK